MRKPKRKPLTRAQMDLVFELANAANDWFLDEVPADNWDHIPNLQRRDDILAIVASGGMTPKMLNGIYAAIGFDVLAVETNPNTAKSEPDGNAYHFVVETTNREDFPGILHGPFCAETRVDHWFEVDDLDSYWTGLDPIR